MAQYKKQYNVTSENVFHSSYTNQKSERMTGCNNPGYQHAGKMSSFSTHSIQYAALTDEEKQTAIANQINKANKTKANNKSYTTTLEYYTSRGFTADEAEILRKQRQATFTLEKCVEKYGEKDGYKRWMDRQRKWLNTLDNLPIEEKARIARAKTLALTNSYSQISKTLFESIIQNIS